MSGGCGDLENPAAEVEVDGLSRPFAEAVEGADVLGRVADDGGARPVGELRVAVSVIVVAVRMRDNQFVVLARVLGEMNGASKLTALLTRRMKVC
jgi:hypothetical protein